MEMGSGMGKTLLDPLRSFREATLSVVKRSAALLWLCSTTHSPSTVEPYKYVHLASNHIVAQTVLKSCAVVTADKLYAYCGMASEAIRYRF